LLAYVFWHVPRESAEAHEYESLHREFHAVLQRANVNGLVRVKVHRLEAIPWLGGRPGYEDWHQLEGSAALDVLNRAAVSGMRQIPHDRIAALAADGTAGLYGVRQGRPIDPRMAYWLSKPAGMSYADFEASLAPLVADGCCLWGRRMTLGPTPEFCLHAPGARTLPYPALAIEMTLLQGDPAS
jgi:hypothetical protein